LCESFFDNFSLRYNIRGRVRWAAVHIQFVVARVSAGKLRFQKMGGMYANKRLQGRISAVRMSIALGLG
jgi:hypothetical protein